MIEPLVVTVDTAQQRIKRDRISTLITGDDWGIKYRSNTYVDPVTKTGMLCPAPRSSAWDSTGTGIYTRYRKSDYTLTSAKWIELTTNFSTNYYLKSADPSGNPGEAVFTNAKQPRNGGVYVKWFAANGSADDWVQMECGYGDATGSGDAVSLRVYSGGKCEVWRYGVIDGTYNISGNDGNPQQTENTFADILIIPFRKAELLVISNRGGGFTHVFSDIDDQSDDPTIIPELKFWWYVPQGFAYVQCAPIQYPKTGYLTGVKSYLQNPPETGQSPLSTIYHDANGGSVTTSLVLPDAPGTGFTPNGTDTICRIRVDLEGNGIYSPNVYGATAYFPRLTASTDSTHSTTLTNYITKCTFEVPDSPSDVHFEIELKNPDAIRIAGASNIRYVSNRPLTANFGTYRVLDGLTEAPRFVEGHRYTSSANDTADRLTIAVRDRWKSFENYMFSDPVPLDGMNLAEAFRFLVKTAGFSDSDLAIDAIAFNLPISQSPSDGEFSVQIEVGDTIADWLTRLHDDYCATYLMGWQPRADGIKFVLRLPNATPTVADVLLYEKISNYLGGVGDTPTTRKLIPVAVFREYSEEVLEPEANDIWVTGFDVRSQRPIICHKADANSIDPTLAPASRPKNWLGVIRKYALEEPAITSQTALERATNILYDRLTPFRVIAEFESDLLAKADGSLLWRGDIVSLQNRGWYRITSICSQLLHEPNDKDWYWRPTKYTCERVYAWADVPKGEDD